MSLSSRSAYSATARAALAKGDGPGGTFQTIAKLTGVTGLDAATLVANGYLIVH